MSTNYTENYNLCQWESGDKVLREDFNADNAKLDAALAGLQNHLNQNTAKLNTAYTTTLPQVVPGAYTGDGAASRTINLGFRPKAVLVIPGHLYFATRSENPKMVYGGIAVAGGTAPFISVSLTSNGFTVYYSGSTGSTQIWTNTVNVKYFYIAIR